MPTITSIASLSVAVADSSGACVAVGVILLLAVIAWACIATYAEINPIWHRLHEAENNIEVAQHKRVSLEDALLDVAERYAGHEKGIHLRVSKDRRGGGHKQLAGQAIVFVTQLATSFPALKADQTYGQLMNDLRMLENELQIKYEAYNAIAREYNDKRTCFPPIIFANLMNFRPAVYLDPSRWYPA